jgi:hypothetical protein
VGDLIRTCSAQEQAIVGETLQPCRVGLPALAEPDAVVVAESTRPQIGTRWRGEIGTGIRTNHRMKGKDGVIVGGLPF